MKKIETISKLAALVIFNFTIFYVTSPLLLTGILILFIIAGLFSSYPFINRLKAITPVAAMIILFQLLFNYTVPIDTRLILGYSAAIRLLAISLSVLFFLSITSITELVQLFSFLPKNVLLLIIMTSYFIPGIVHESGKIKAAQKSRGMNINNVRIITNLASLIVPLIHRVLQRAEILSLAIVSRGYEE